ncbi:MAG TPA: YetF domain-containing protein [Duganella sp.]|nr:YetF domain-containing protein [Duganella sp.]
MRRFTLPRPLCLVRDGKKLERNLRRELIADEELQEMLREHEIVDLAEVRRAYLEPDGQLTVIRNRRGGARDAAPASATKEIQEIHMAHANPIQIQKYLKGDYPADVSAAFKGPSQDHAERGDDDGGGRRRDH